MNGSTIIGFMKSVVIGMVAIASVGVVGYAFFAFGVNFNDFYPALGWISWVPKARARAKA